MTASEKELIRQLKRGEDKAYRFLYDTHYEVLCRIAREYLKDDFLAETIVGDTIFNLWEKRLTIEIQSSLRAYLVRAVRNRCINYLQLNYVLKKQNFSQPMIYWNRKGFLPLQKIIRSTPYSKKNSNQKYPEASNSYLTNAAQFSR